MRFIVKKNTILYGQDMTAHRGIPEGTYDVERLDKDKVKLTASGYGEKDNYGNGALYVSIKNLSKAVQERIKNEL